MNSRKPACEGQLGDNRRPEPSKPCSIPGQSLCNPGAHEPQPFVPNHKPKPKTPKPTPVALLGVLPTKARSPPGCHELVLHKWYPYSLPKTSDLFNGFRRFRAQGLRFRITSVHETELLTTWINEFKRLFLTVLDCPSYILNGFLSLAPNPRK